MAGSTMSEAVAFLVGECIVLAFLLICAVSWWLAREMSR
jgi:hypothetical protein